MITLFSFILFQNSPVAKEALRFLCGLEDVRGNISYLRSERKSMRWGRQNCTALKPCTYFKRFVP